MDKKLKHKRRASARGDEAEVTEESSRDVVLSADSRVERDVSVSDLVGSVAVGSVASYVANVALGSDVVSWGRYSGVGIASISSVSSLVGSVLVGVPKVVSGGVLFDTGLSGWGVQRGAVLVGSSKDLVGDVVLGDASCVPSLNVFFESSVSAFERGWLAGSLPRVKSIVGGVSLRSRVVPLLTGASSPLSLGVEVERELESGLDVFAGLSGSGVELGLLEEVLSVEGGVIPRSLSAVGNGVMVFVVVERRDSEWHLLVAHLVKVLLEEFIGSGVKIFVREVAEEGEEVESIDSLEKESLGRLNFRGVVEVFDLRKDPYSSGYVLELVRSRLPALYTHGPGALIIALSNEGVGRKLYKNIKKISSCPTYFLNLAMREGEELEDLASLLILGSLSKDVDLTGGSSHHAIRRRVEALRRTVEKLSYFVKRQVSNGRHVDVVQYGLKVATFSAIIHKAVSDKLRELAREGKKVDTRVIYEAIHYVKEEYLKVRVEESLKSGSEGSVVVPDITFEDEGSNVCVEVETLIGTGEPMKKIDESVEKYRGLRGACGKVWIVLPPEAAFLHMKELEERLKILEVLPEQNYPESIEVKVLALRFSKPSPWRDVFGWALIDLRGFKKEVRSVVRGGGA